MTGHARLHRLTSRLRWLRAPLLRLIKEHGILGRYFFHVMDGKILDRS